MISGASHSWTDDDGRAEAAALDIGDDLLLALVARLPLSPLGVLLPFLNCGTATAYRWACELRDRGLLAALTTPLRTSGRPGRLWLPTELGLAVLAQGGATESNKAAALGRRRATPSRLLTELPSLLAVYELLASLAAAGPGSPHLHNWEHPWCRMLPEQASARAAGPRVARCRRRRHCTGIALRGRSAAGTCCCRTPAVGRCRRCAGCSAASPNIRRRA